MSNNSKPVLPPEFNSWTEIWDEHQLRGKELTRLRAELAEANRTIDTLRAGDAHKLGEVFALREIASKVGTTGVTYHAIIKEVLEWKEQLAEARNHAKVLADMLIEWGQYDSAPDPEPVFAALKWAREQDIKTMPVGDALLAGLTELRDSIKKEQP